MFTSIIRNGWIFALRGVAAIALGILCLAWPSQTLPVLVILFGAYLLIDGLALLIALASGDLLAPRHAWAVGVMGALGIVAAILVFLWPNITAMVLLYLVAIWAIGMGVFQILAAIELGRDARGEFWLVLGGGEFWLTFGGLLSIVFGTLLVAFPGAGLISLVWLVGMWAIAFGVSSLGLAHRLHRIHRVLKEFAPIF